MSAVCCERGERDGMVPFCRAPWWWCVVGAERTACRHHFAFRSILRPYSYSFPVDSERCFSTTPACFISHPIHERSVTLVNHCNSIKFVDLRLSRGSFRPGPQHKRRAPAVYLATVFGRLLTLVIVNRFPIPSRYLVFTS